MKVGFLITARLKSTRLPLKILKDLNGKTVIERIIDRAKEIKGISNIVICTSYNSQDSQLLDIAKNNDIYYFTGHEDDVLNRLFNAAKLFDLDYFLGITADNPLFTIDHSNQIVNECKKNIYDYIKLESLPLGAATYGMKVKALETVCSIKTLVDTEIWGPLINQRSIFNIKTIKIIDKLSRPELRFTLDYQEDYDFINNIYSNVPFSKVINLYNVIDYLDKNPDLLEINKNCKQLQLEKDIVDRINKYYRDNTKEIIKIKEEIYHR